MSDKACTEACIKGGAKYVFVRAKSTTSTTRTLPTFAANAGHSVKLTGEMTGDTIKVSKIEMAAAKMK